MRRVNKKLVLYSIGLIVLGGLFGLAITRYTAVKQFEKTQNRYNLLAKRVLVDSPNQAIVNFSELKRKIIEYNSANLINVKSSIYFEYLPTGTAIGVDEDQQMIGASLLKTPLAINLYKLAENNKINLNEKVSLKQEWLNNQFGELYKKGVGYQISLRNLAELMLKDSDNTAELALFDVMKDRISTLSFYSFIDLDYQINKDQTLQMGTRSYTSILKCLYFSCYLNKDDSQEILDYLSQSKYDKRLLLYINDNIKVAHKYGTFGDKVQSDCGIFYLSNKNYALCVMVEGDDPMASRHIGNISQIVYEYMNSLPVDK